RRAAGAADYLCARPGPGGARQADLPLPHRTCRRGNKRQPGRPDLGALDGRLGNWLGSHTQPVLPDSARSGPGHEVRAAMANTSPRNTRAWFERQSRAAERGAHLPTVNELLRLSPFINGDLGADARASAERRLTGIGKSTESEAIH